MPSSKSMKLALVAVAAALATTTSASETVQAPSTNEDEPTTYPKDFKLTEALNFYTVESTSLLKRSMLSAGFSVDETIEINESYLDFASRALVAEMERIEKIKATLLEKKKALGAQSCSAPGSCVDQEAATSSVGAADAGQKKKDDKFSDEFAHFQTPDLQPGQAELLRWDDNGLVVQDYAARVGLPPQLVPTLREYIKGMGLLDIMMNMLYDDPLPPDGAKWFSFQSPYQKDETDPSKVRNFTWNVERPAKKWKSDMHWFNTADELSHEDALRALAKGGFDEVLKGIGEKFNLDELHVDSFGFVAVTNCDRGFIHTDWEDVDGRAFNFLVGIENPSDGGPELVVENERKGETYYGSNAGILVGDGTRHGTRECDHRASRGVRITASIYLADVTEDNLSILAGDTTSIFPPMEEVGEEWIWTQRGRHWRKEGGGPGLVGDPGRAAFKFEDASPGCTEQDCDNDGSRPRNSCMKTCRVFIDDKSEYMPGKERREIFGY